MGQAASVEGKEWLTILAKTLPEMSTIYFLPTCQVPSVFYCLVSHPASGYSCACINILLLWINDFTLKLKGMAYNSVKYLPMERAEQKKPNMYVMGVTAEMSK